MSEMTHGQEELRKIKLLKKVNLVKADQSPQVIKYLLRRKSVEGLQAPVHDVDFNQAPKKPQKFFFKTFQRVSIDPNIKLDELREEKWSIVSNNYKSLIEKSRNSVIKRNESADLPKPANQPIKIQFLTRRQSIEYRLKEISKQASSSGSPMKTSQNLNQPSTQLSSPPPKHSLQDPFYPRFKKFYDKIGITNQEPIHLKLQRLIMNNKPRSRLSNHSQHSSSKNPTPTPSLSPKKPKVIKMKLSQQNIYLKELQHLCNIASNMQNSLKRDQNQEISETSQKVSNIQAEFNKFHNMLTKDLESLDFVDAK